MTPRNGRPDWADGAAIALLLIGAASGVIVTLILQWVFA